MDTGKSVCETTIDTLRVLRISYVAFLGWFLTVDDPVIFVLSFSNRISDLRVVDLLDGLCDRMQDYTLQKVSRVLVEFLSL